MLEEVPKWDEIEQCSFSDLYFYIFLSWNIPSCIDYASVV